MDHVKFPSKSFIRNRDDKARSTRTFLSPRSLMLVQNYGLLRAGTHLPSFTLQATHSLFFPLRIRFSETEENLDNSVVVLSSTEKGLIDLKHTLALMVLHLTQGGAS